MGFSEWYEKHQKAKGAYKVAKAKAYKITQEAKNLKRETNQGIVKEKEKTKRTIARATALSSAVASGMQKASQQASNASTALSQWNQIINTNPQPAEGTGAPESGDTAGGESSTTVAPVGNE